jgi:hypothetical protein
MVDGGRVLTAIRARTGTDAVILATAASLEIPAAEESPALAADLAATVAVETVEVKAPALVAPVEIPVEVMVATVAAAATAEMEVVAVVVVAEVAAERLSGLKCRLPSGYPLTSKP